jgi:YHS domain-containing protein
MLTTALAALVLGFTGPQTPMHCVTTLEDITGAPANTYTYAGAVFGTCCGGCGAPFQKDPAAAIAKASKADKAIGAFMYDPVSGLRIDGKKAAASSDYKAIRYFFASEDEKKKFDAKPAMYVSDVKSEAYFCPITKHATASDKAGGFVDYKGTRYFTCCGDCVAELRKDPSKYVGNAASSVKTLSVVEVKETK